MKLAQYSAASVAFAQFTHGSDDRVWVSSTNSTPWKMIVRVRSTYADGSSYIGTGAMIGPNDVLTAGHNIWDTSTNSYPIRISVTPAMSGSYQPYGTISAKSWTVSTDYRDTGNFQYDYGVINLSSNIGSSTGYFSYSSAYSNNLTGLIVNTAGYPDDLYGTRYMYHASDDIDYTVGNLMKYNGGMDTYAGMSGSPVWVYTTSGTRVIVGVHTHGGYYFNGGTRLTDPIYKDITAWANDEGIGNNTSTSLTGTSISDSITGTDSRCCVGS